MVCIFGWESYLSLVSQVYSSGHKKVPFRVRSMVQIKTVQIVITLRFL